MLNRWNFLKTGFYEGIMDDLSTEVSNIILPVPDSHTTMPEISRFSGIIIPNSQDDRAT